MRKALILVPALAIAACVATPEDKVATHDVGAGVYVLDHSFDAIEPIEENWLDKAAWRACPHGYARLGPTEYYPGYEDPDRMFGGQMWTVRCEGAG